MAIADQKSSSSSSSDGKVWGFFKRPFRPSGNNTNNNTTTTTTTSSSSMSHNLPQPNGDGSNPHASNSVSSVARSLLPTRRRLKLDPCNKLYFPCTSYLVHFLLLFIFILRIFAMFRNFIYFSQISCVGRFCCQFRFAFRFFCFGLKISF